MKFFCGHTQEPFFILHGGAGPMDPSDAGIRKASLSLQRIARHALLLMQKTPSEELHISSPSPTGEIEGESRLSQGIIASEREQLEFVTRLLEGLEDDEGFNAGYGSALQADGQARLSAALMNGKRQCFSGVISLSEVQHPSRLALELQTRASRVLTSPGHQNLARELQIPVADLRSPARL
ncbi:MAG: isoaspartyl peptidase/L-asparaginase, partial [Proteobacteria bacterium]|nr:isoaspartyl peptidase/L-asparaginase [Pseudomonadota bacterium]